MCPQSTDSAPNSPPREAFIAYGPPIHLDPKATHANAPGVMSKNPKIWAFWSTPPPNTPGFCKRLVLTEPAARVTLGAMSCLGNSAPNSACRCVQIVQSFGKSDKFRRDYAGLVGVAVCSSGCVHSLSLARPDLFRHPIHFS